MRHLLRLPLCSILLGCCAHAAAPAKNVILFVGDAGGLSTLNAAGIYAHGKPLSLFIQSLPHVALSDTSALDGWVTDSAAGMTALVTGQKTNNGMLSYVPAGKRPAKTILEYAEERGLSTGVVTNMAVWDATPGACYAHVPSRKESAEIFRQVFTPRFGDGVDVLVGADRQRLWEATHQAGFNVTEAMQRAGYTFAERPEQLSAAASRAISVYDGEDFAAQPVVDNVLEILTRNPKGYFLMVEWDMHTSDLKKGLDRVIVMDELIRHVAGKVGPDTLIIYAADHSYDLRLTRGKTSSPLAQQIVFDRKAADEKTSAVRVADTHTGEEVVIAARGPGAERLHGFIPNTEVFHVMLSAYGWPESP